MHLRAVNEKKNNNNINNNNNKKHSCFGLVNSLFVDLLPVVRLASLPPPAAMPFDALLFRFTSGLASSHILSLPGAFGSEGSQLEFITSTLDTSPFVNQPRV